MMKLHRRSWTVRWAYLWTHPPATTSLCPLFWRVVLVTPLKLSAPIIVACGVSSFVYFNPYVALAIVASVGALIGAVCVIDYVHHAMSAPTPDQERSLPYQMYRAVKDRVCPLVQIEP